MTVRSLRSRRPHGLALLLALSLLSLLAGAGAVRAQTPAPADTTALVGPAPLDSAALAHAPWLYRADRRVLLRVYDLSAPQYAAPLRAADRSAYPVYFAAAPVAWAGSLLRGGPYDAAYRLSLSELAAVASTVALKRLFGRPRPFLVLRRVDSRSRRLTRAFVVRRRRYSFPSGHAATGFALATSLTLSFPHWYVAAPSFGWAALVATSRLWLGVHYPSDVVAGALLGSAVGLGVHLLRSTLTPASLRNDGPAAPSTAPAVRFYVPL